MAGRVVTGRGGWAAAAAAVYAAGAVALLGVRARRHKSSTGSAGFRLSRSGPARVAAVALGGALAAGVAGPVLAGLRGRSRSAREGPGGWPVTARLIGAGVALGGFLLAWRAQDEMGRSWRVGVDPGERTELVTSGMFASVRNPIFTAMIAAQAGTVLMCPTRSGAIGVGLLIAGCELQVRKVEEPYLVRQHDLAYRAYAAGTGRFLPRLGRLDPDGAAST